MKKTEAWTEEARVLNQMCPKCQNDCKQPPQVVMVGCSHFEKLKVQSG